jgi:hypothetical protein
VADWHPEIIGQIFRRSDGVCPPSLQQQRAAAFIVIHLARMVFCWNQSLG